MGDPALSLRARSLIEDPGNEKLVSPASYWEVAIKVSIGKYALPATYDEFIRNAITNQGFGILPVFPSHTAHVCTLPFHHRDPFDRLLVAQSIAEGLSLVSGDAVLDAYGINRLW